MKYEDRNYSGALRLVAFVALPGDVDSVPTTYEVVYKHQQLHFTDQTPFTDFKGHQASCGKHIQIQAKPSYTENLFENCL